MKEDYIPLPSAVDQARGHPTVNASWQMARSYKGTVDDITNRQQLDQRLAQGQGRTRTVTLNKPRFMIDPVTKRAFKLSKTIYITEDDPVLDNDLTRMHASRRGGSPDRVYDPVGQYWVRKDLQVARPLDREDLRRLLSQKFNVR